MAKFEFAKKNVELEFPTVCFRVAADSVKISDCKKVAMWLIDEGKRLTKLSEDETLTDEKADRIIAAETEKLYKKIDMLIEEGASEKIFEHRCGEVYDLYNDAVDVLRFVLSEIRAVWYGSAPCIPHPATGRKKGGKRK